MKSFNYFRRIGFSNAPSVSEKTLYELHKAHVFNVPFENLDIINKIPIVLDQDRFLNKIIEENRGGICYELNGAFKQLLDNIGFNSFFISCNVYVPAMDKYGADFGHIALITNIREEQYLVDVGFGDAFIEPLKLVYDIPQVQYGIYYRLRKLLEGEVLLEKSFDNVQYQKMFKFLPVPRQLEEFAEVCAFHQHAPQAPFNKQALCTRPTINGRITLTAKNFIIKTGNEKVEEVVPSVSVFNELLGKYFNISLELSCP